MKANKSPEDVNATYWLPRYFTLEYGGKVYIPRYFTVCPVCRWSGTGPATGLQVYRAPSCNTATCPVCSYSVRKSNNTQAAKPQR